MPVVVDEPHQRPEEREKEIGDPVCSLQVDAGKEFCRNADIIDDARRQRHHKRIQKVSKSPSDANSDADHPLPKVLPVKQRMYNLHVSLERDDAKTGDRSVQSDPDQVLICDELTQEVSPQADRVLVPKLKGVGDRHGDAREHVDRHLVDDENVHRLSFLSIDDYQNGHDQTVGEHAEKSDKDDDDRE